MTSEQYRFALSALGLKITGAAMRHALGISDRASQKYAAGWPIAKPVALLLETYLRIGYVPKR